MSRPSTMSFRPVEAAMLIGGERVGGSERLEVRNPARPSEVVGTIVRGTRAHVDAAVAAAGAAQPKWAARSATERAAILGRALARLEQDIDARAALFVRENGKTLAEAKSELAGVPKRQQLTIALAPQLDHPREVEGANVKTFVGYRPFGVVLSIVPWNSPVSLAFAQVIPALLAGNSVIVKPPESCPLSLMRALDMAAEALPAGVLNYVTGSPAEIGDALTTHAGIGKIGFTGSIPSARRNMANAAGTIKGITLELGGNDPAIVLDDADLAPEAMQRMVRIVYRMTGQVCMAIKRVYVARPIHDRFVAAFAREADRIVVGEGLDAEVTMGPLHTAAGLERARRLVQDAERRGAHLMRLGRIADRATFEAGHFLEPIVVTGLADDAPLASEEQFCPALPIFAYDEVEEAVARANATVYGLGGSVWGKDLERAEKIAWQIDAGTVFVNTHGTEAINRNAPYGGVKQSGIGRRAGIDGIREYLQLQTLTVLQ